MRSGAIPDLTTPNLQRPDQPAPTFFGAYGEWMTSPPPSWDDIAWMAEEWGGPFMFKGVCRVDDARRAVDAGVTAMSVANHGGNNPRLDACAHPGAARRGGGRRRRDRGAPGRRGTARQRRGEGPRARRQGRVIGRAYLWGLAANGKAGVENVLDVLRGGIDPAVLGLARSSVHELGPDDVVVPPGFTVTLGAGAPQDAAH